MITKAIIQSINAAGNRCIVRMPLFETAANPMPVEAEALVNIAPGIFNNLAVGDVVFVSFEENALEKPVILGKLFRGSNTEGKIRGGGGILDTLKVRTAASIPASTNYVYPDKIQQNYINLNTPKKTADYIKWLEQFTKNNLNQLDEHFRCFKNWTQWQLQSENVEVDDGDLDENPKPVKPCLYQDENNTCDVCEHACTKNKKRSYLKLTTDKKYPDL